MKPKCYIWFMYLLCISFFFFTFSVYAFRRSIYALVGLKLPKHFTSRWLLDFFLKNNATSGNPKAKHAVEQLRYLILTTTTLCITSKLDCEFFVHNIVFWWHDWERIIGTNCHCRSWGISLLLNIMRGFPMLKFSTLASMLYLISPSYNSFLM